MWRAVSEHEIQALRRIYAAMTRWDLDELIADVAHDIEWTLPEPLPWGGTRHGHDGIEAFASVFRDHVDGTWADPDDFLDAGDRIVVLGRLRGQARATGQKFEVGFAHVWTLTDGVASRLRSYFDTASVLAALEGRLPPEPPADI
jgi:ketosteroid isomerase-like protein